MKKYSSSFRRNAPLLLKILGTSIVRGVISIVITLLIARILGFSSYGKYIYILFVIGLSQIFCAPLDQLIKRFSADLDPETSFTYSFTVSALKLLINLVVVSIGYFFLLKEKFEGDSIYAIIAIILSFNSIVQTIYFSALSHAQARQKIWESQLILTIDDLIRITSFLIIFYFLKMEESGLIFFSLIDGASNLLLTFVALHIGQNPRNGLFSKCIYQEQIFKFELVKDNLKQYAFPLILLAIVQSIKNNLATLILGNLDLFSSVGILEYIKQIFSFFNKGLSAVFGTITPKIVKLRTNNAEKFQSMFKIFLNLNFTAYLLFAFALNRGVIAWINYTNNSQISDINILVNLYSSMFVCWGAMQSQSNASLMERKTWNQLLIATFRAGSYIFVLFFTFQNTSILGILKAEFFATVATIFFTMARKNIVPKYFRIDYLWQGAIAIMLAALTSYQLIFIN